MESAGRRPQNRLNHLDTLSRAGESINKFSP